MFAVISFVYNNNCPIKLKLVSFSKSVRMYIKVSSTKTTLTTNQGIIVLRQNVVSDFICSGLQFQFGIDSKLMKAGTLETF